jgi:hypothetical protein
MKSPHDALKKSFLRTGHGQGKGKPHIEVVADELSQPVLAAPPAAPASPLVRNESGQIADTLTAKELGRRGGLAKARKARLVDALGLVDLAEDAAFKPYRTAAEAFAVHKMAELAQLAGGEVGAGPSSIVATAALQLAASRFCFDQAAHKGIAELMKLGSQLGNDSRQNLLAAYELAVREAKIREASEGPRDPLLG